MFYCLGDECLRITTRGHRVQLYRAEANVIFLKLRETVKMDIPPHTKKEKSIKTASY